MNNPKWFYPTCGILCFICFGVLTFALGPLPGILITLQLVIFIFIGWILYSGTRLWIDFSSKISTEETKPEEKELINVQDDYSDVKKAIFELELDKELGKITQAEYLLQLDSYKKRAYWMINRLEKVPHSKDYYKQLVTDELAPLSSDKQTVVPTQKEEK